MSKYNNLITDINYKEFKTECYTDRSADSKNNKFNIKSTKHKFTVLNDYNKFFQDKEKVCFPYINNKTKNIELNNKNYPDELSFLKLNKNPDSFDYSKHFYGKKKSNSPFNIVNQSNIVFNPEEDEGKVLFNQANQIETYNKYEKETMGQNYHNYKEILKRINVNSPHPFKYNQNQLKLSTNNFSNNQYKEFRHPLSPPNQSYKMIVKQPIFPHNEKLVDNSYTILVNPQSIHQKSVISENIIRNYNIVNGRDSDLKKPILDKQNRILMKQAIHGGSYKLNLFENASDIYRNFKSNDANIYARKRSHNTNFNSN